MSTRRRIVGSAIGAAKALAPLLPFAMILAGATVRWSVETGLIVTGFTLVVYDLMPERGP